jgi:Flp pilus assembly pilin Flp
MQHLIETILKEEDGQDLVEYTLVASVMAFAAVAGIQGVASGVTAAFLKIGDKFTASFPY